MSKNEQMNNLSTVAGSEARMSLQEESVDEYRITAQLRDGYQLLSTDASEGFLTL